MKYSIKPYDRVVGSILDLRLYFKHELDSWKYDYIEDKLNDSIERQIWFRLTVQFRRELG